MDSNKYIIESGRVASPTDPITPSPLELITPAIGFKPAVYRRRGYDATVSGKTFDAEYEKQGGAR